MSKMSKMSKCQNVETSKRLDFGCFDTNETLLATLPVSEDFNLITDSKRCYLDLDLATGSVCLSDRNRNPNDQLTLPFGIYIRA